MYVAPASEILYVLSNVAVTSNTETTTTIPSPGGENDTDMDEWN